MMQPLKEMTRTRICSVLLNKLWTTRQLSPTCMCSTLSSLNQPSKRCNPTRSWRKVTTSCLHANFKSQFMDLTFSNNQQSFFHSSKRQMSNKTLRPTELSELEYEAKAAETLESLSDFFEELQEVAPCSEDYDSGLGSGVLTIHFGGSAGTFVINKQTPNKQIWLSSPLTGPKRYDYCDGKWMYLRDGSGLHSLLEKETSEILDVNVSLKKCKYYS